MATHPINDLADAVERASFGTGPVILLPFFFLRIIYLF